MGCVCSANFVVLVNGSPSNFFKCGRGLRQGCPLSPLLFLLVVECLSRLILKEKREGTFSGFKISIRHLITYIMFVDDVLILGPGSIEEWFILKNILDSLCKALGMDINLHKSNFIHINVEDQTLTQIQDIFGISSTLLDNGFKYLGFFLKPNNYEIVDWLWIFQRVEKRISLWAYRWLSLGGRLVLIKKVLQNILVF